MADIFLSYAKEDREVARGLSRRLIQSGWTVWWDRRIPAGRTWRQMLEAALRDMRCMVVLWSSHSIESDWVKEEAEEARLRKKLVPALIEGVIPPVGFRTIQAADLTDWDGVGDSRGVRQLIADLELLLGKPAERAEVAPRARMAPGWRADRSRTEVTTSSVETPRAEQVARLNREPLSKNPARWKVAAGFGVALGLALGIFALWRGWAPVTDEAATAVATGSAPSSAEIAESPRIVKLTVYGPRRELKPDETIALAVRAQFADGTEKEITDAVEWATSNARVAKLDGAGRITALESGTTKITATYGGVASSGWNLAVASAPPKPAPEPVLVGLRVSAYKKELKPQEKITLNVTGKYSDGSEKPLSSGWFLTNNNAGVVSVSAQGEVEAWRAGDAEIIARFGNVTSAPLRLVVKEPQRQLAVQPQPGRRTEYAPGKTSPESALSKAPDTRPTATEPSAEQVRAKIMPYISRAKNFRAQGNYRSAMAELAAAQTVDPTSQEIGAEIEQTKRACIAERKLGNRSLDCSL
jgi:hypothetical protein